MVAKRIDVNDTSLSELIALIKSGTQVVLVDEDVAIARMLPTEPSGTFQRVAGLHEDIPGFWMSDDFDEPLGDDFWLGEDRT